jgi:coproporphyrinogen III oxidase-like Fe-S oxidoreductase
MDLCEKKEPCTTFFEILTKKQIWLEVLMLGLRRPQGITLEDLLHTDSQIEALAQRQVSLERLVRDGYVEYHRNNVRLTQRGLAVENEILAQLAHI